MCINRKLLKSIREEKKIKREHLAYLTNTSNSVIFSIEEYENYNPGFCVMIKIANALKIDNIKDIINEKKCC